MSNPEPDHPIDEWLRRGIDAARAGDKATARTLLERVVEHDQRHEMGWFWLATVVNDIGEKKICLGNVLAINPGNERAQKLLQRIQALEQGESTPPPAPAKPPASAPSETTPDAPVPIEGSAMPTAVDDREALLGSGDNNRTIWYIAAGLGTIAVLILIIVLVMMMGGDDDNGNQSDAPPNVAQNPTLPDDNAAPPTEEGSTPPADVTPTPSRVPNLAPATWTPVPTNTPVPDVPPTIFPPAPAGLTGKIIMRSGQVPGDLKNQPITIIRPDGSNRQPLTGTDRGHTPWLSPDGNRFVYIKYVVGTQEYLIQFDNLQGTAPLSGANYWGSAAVLLDPEQPTWSPDGQFIAFTAKSGSAQPDLYRLSLSDPTGANPGAIEHLTQDAAVESWPAFSPDGQSIVYAADLSPVTAGAGTELRVYRVVDGIINNLTTNGAELIEAAPDWSPDSTQIVFQGKEANSTTNDIYLFPASGGTPQKIIDSDFDDIQPRFSPDGRYIVFSSNRTGNWDVFVYEIATNTYYQVTTNDYTDVANDWGN